MSAQEITAELARLVASLARYLPQAPTTEPR
jgi:hypothetical protein